MNDIRISAQDVKARLARGDRVTFVDARNPKAWAGARDKLRDAIRVPAAEVEQYYDKVPEGALIAIYCT